MKNLLDPYWIYFINTAPALALSFIMYGKYRIIRHFLDEKGAGLWTIFAGVFVLFTLGNLVYAVWLGRKKLSISPLYGLITVLFYVPFLYFLGWKSSDIQPFSVPEWMVADTVILYPGYLLLPAVAYALLVMAVSMKQKRPAWTNLLAAIMVPLLWFVFFNIAAPMVKSLESRFGVHAFLVIFIASTLLFLFFLLRLLVIIIIKKKQDWVRYRLFWEIPSSLLLPLGGLLLNNKNGLHTLETGGIFGDFNNHWFYILTVTNAILICLPQFTDKKYRLALFAGRSVTFSFSLYFFLVFLPFLPLALVAIIAFGLGFLMLAPLLLFVIHTHKLLDDFNDIAATFSRKTAALVVAAGILVIPAIISGFALRDRHVIMSALDHVYHPDYVDNSRINENALRQVLSRIKYSKSEQNVAIGEKIPFILSWYNWITLDNLTLSDGKINTLERIFFGAKDTLQDFDSFPVELGFEITDVASQSHYNAATQSWKSTVELTIHNRNSGSEFTTSFVIPNDMFVSDYWLYINGKKEPGILAEKKTAMWVYANIRNTKRDPGILYYRYANELALKVFPFTKNQTRKTGMEFIHREPATIIINDKKISLGKKTETPDFISRDMAWISSRTKAGLRQETLKPYLHFILDASENADREEVIKRVETFLKTNNLPLQNAKVTYANAFPGTTPFGKNWQSEYKNREFHGGFWLGRSLEKILFDAWKNPSGSYPLIIISGDMTRLIWKTDLRRWEFAYPDNDIFFVLEKNRMAARGLSNFFSKSVPKNLSAAKTLRVWEKNGRKYYLADNNRSSIILLQDKFALSADSLKNDWQSGMMLYGKSMSLTLHPQLAVREWAELVSGSFRSHIMTPYTTFLSLENEAQKEVLRQKQKDALAGNKALDLGNDSVRMSEPGILFTGIFLGIFLLFRKRIISRMGNDGNH